MYCDRPLPLCISTITHILQYGKYIICTPGFLPDCTRTPPHYYAYSNLVFISFLYYVYMYYYVWNKCTNIYRLRFFYHTESVSSVPLFCPRLNINYKFKNIFHFILFGRKYTLYDNLISTVDNSPTHGNTESILCHVRLLWWFY
jgi:hypothetical protein